MTDHDEWDCGPFKVGDVVEGFGFIVNTKINGMQILIESPLGKYEDARGDIDHGYLVTGDGEKFLAPANRLRRRKPPMTGLEDVLSLFNMTPERIKELA